MGWLTLAAMRERTQLIKRLNLPYFVSGALKDQDGVAVTDIRNTYNDTAFTDRLMRWTAQGNSASISAIGAAALGSVGTATSHSTSAADVYSSGRKVEYLVTTPGASAVTGVYSPALSNSGQGGFTMFAEWGAATGISTSTNRAFCGISTSGSAPTDVEPSSVAGLYGMGWDSADTNATFMYKDSGGTTLKVDLGSNFIVPTVDRTQVYQVRIWSIAGSGVVNYHIKNINNSAVSSGSVSITIPAQTTMIGPRVWMSVGGTSSVIGLAFYDMWIKSDR